MTPVGSNHLSSLPKYDALAPANSGVRAVRSGAWSDSATWGGRNPNGRVIIPRGLSVVFDVANSPTLQSVRVEGCLELSNRVDSRLNTEFLYVAPGGEFLAGTQGSAVPGSVTAEVVFADLGPLNARVDPTLTGKGLVSASRVRLYGAFKSPKEKVSAAPTKGDTVVRLKQAPQGWRVGDRVVLTGTRWIPQKTRRQVVLSSPTEDEVRYIKAISGSSVTLDAPLAFDHNSPDPAVAAYLVNYTRNIRFASENGATLPAHERAHSMFLSTETTIEGAEFFEMGRTDKSKRAIDAARLSTPTSTSNVKGRYPVHLHQSGFAADNVAPVIRDVAVWGSPGWGVAQHNGNAFLFQNNTWDTFGAGFVAESGNETGAWVENTAVKGTGVNHIVKDAADVRAFDLGRTGDGFWLQSRAVRLHKNLAVGMTGGMGYVFFHRGTDLGGKLPLTTAFVSKSLCMPAAMRFRPQPIEAPQIAQFTDNEVIASEVGFHIVKPRPIEPHDIRTMLDNFSAWEVVTGVDITYTSRYTLTNSLLIATANNIGWRTSVGVHFGKNTYDLAVAKTRIEGFEYGIDLSKVSTRTFGVNNQYVVAGVTFNGIKNQTLLNRDGTDQILSSMPSPRPVSVAFNWGSGPVVPGRSGLYVYVQGVKTDSTGQTPYPVAKKEFMINWTNFVGLTRQRGWYTVGGSRAMVVPEFYSDRLTGEIFQTSFVAKPSGYFRWPSQLSDGSPANQGTLDLRAGPPAASNDSKSTSANRSVAIDAFSNDRTNDGKLLAAGHTHAREGNVEQLPDGSFRYTPYPDFRGRDSFDYWIRNRQGQVDRATVTVTIN